ncbi:hypothetical protein A2U01_0097806, partial [Trifolium medium]|nr:hypothetical protein [Trifolium medium]
MKVAQHLAPSTIDHFTVIGQSHLCDLSGSLVESVSTNHTIPNLTQQVLRRLADEGPC